MRLCAAILASFLLTACAAPAPLASSCPAVKEWSGDDQRQIAAAYDGLTPGSILRPVIREWISLHKQSEACNKSI